MSCTLPDLAPSEERHRAEQALMWAYERARRIGYRPGSEEMLALRRADQAHRQARANDLPRRIERSRSDADTSTKPGRVVDLTNRCLVHDSSPDEGPSDRGRN